MMYYYDNERRAAVSGRVETYRSAAALFPAIRRTLERFDGKVLNCRLEKALRDESGAWICTEKRYRFFEIYIYEHGNQITLAQIELDKLPDGKRIPAAELITSAQDKRNGLLKLAADMETATEHINEYKNQIKYLKKQIETIKNNIPYEIRDIYGLDR